MRIADMMPLAMAMRRLAMSLEVRGMDRLLGLLFPPQQQGSGAPFEVPYFEGEFVGEFVGDAASHVDRQVLFHGAYEWSDMRLLRRLAKLTRPVAVDVGANVGVYTLALAPLCARVLAFEPFAPVRVRLETNVARNGLCNVSVHPLGLGARDGEMPFSPPSRENEGRGSFAESGSSMLPVRRGDAYLLEIGVTEVGLIKVDVEGLETEVLDGLADSIARCRPVLCIEANVPVGRLRERLPAGYRFHRHRHRGRLRHRYRLEPVRDETIGGNVFAIPDTAPAAVLALF